MYNSKKLLNNDRSFCNDMTDIAAPTSDNVLVKGLREQGLTKLSPEQLDRFGEEIASVGKKAIGELGDDKDERFLRKLKSGNLSCEVIGRTLIHISFEPVTFLLGVIFRSYPRTVDTFYS